MANKGTNPMKKQKEYTKRDKYKAKKKQQNKTKGKGNHTYKKKINRLEHRINKTNTGKKN